MRPLGLAHAGSLHRGLLPRCTYFRSLWSRASQEGRGCTCVMVAVQDRVAGAFAVADPPKPEARGVIQALEAMGVTCHLLTGDNWRTARAVAADLGILHVEAEVKPEGKRETVGCVRTRWNNPYLSAGWLAACLG